MPQKQVFLLYNNESDKDHLVAQNLSAFFHVFKKIKLRDALAGEDIADTKKGLSESDMVLPLISIDFLSSDKNIDLTEEALESGKEVYPILSRECPWEMNPALKTLAPKLMPKGKPLYEHDEKSQDKAFSDIVKDLALKLTGEADLDKLTKSPMILMFRIGLALLAIAITFLVYNFLGVNEQYVPEGYENALSQLSIIRYIILGVAALLLLIAFFLPKLVKPSFFNLIDKRAL